MIYRWYYTAAFFKFLHPPPSQKKGNFLNKTYILKDFKWQRHPKFKIYSSENPKRKLTFPENN